MKWRDERGYLTSTIVNRWHVKIYPISSFIWRWEIRCLPNNKLLTALTSKSKVEAVQEIEKLFLAVEPTVGE